MSIKIGDKAPDFELADQKGNPFKLSEYRGKKVLLIFHPLIWTSVCTKQLKHIESFLDEFENKNCFAVTISVDPMPGKKALIKEHNLKKIRMLSDFWPHGQVAQKYEVFRSVEGFSERANILIDEKGDILFREVYSLQELPDFSGILKLL